jgi:ASC-1-like (ASCH) protein
MTVHIILQGKGGVGKSLVACLLTQYLKNKQENILCIDTDPVNDTFFSYKAFDVKQIKLLDEYNNINTRSFDDLVELVANHEDDVVIDNGASTFIPFSSYIHENKVIDFFKSVNKNVMIHTVLTGGQALDDTLIGLNSLFLGNYDKIMIWENEFFGEVKKDGKKFIESKIHDKNKDKIKGIITINKQNADTFGKDISLMISNKLTFDEALESNIFTIMPKQRLQLFRKFIFEQLSAVGI